MFSDKTPPRVRQHTGGTAHNPPTGKGGRA
jgi:hypothetical protein